MKSIKFIYMGAGRAAQAGRGNNGISLVGSPAVIVLRLNDLKAEWLR